jgi:hypothetical protein
VITTRSRLSADPADPALNFTLEPYIPPSPPAASAQRPGVILERSVSKFADPGAAEKLLDGLLDHYEFGRLVWSLSVQNSDVAWEFYVYNGGDVRPVTVDELAHSLAPSVRLEPALVRRLDGFNPISVDISNEVLSEGRVSGANGYLNAGPDAAVAYRVDDCGFHLRNYYRKFTVAQRSQADAAIRSSVHLRDGTVHADLAPAEIDELHLAQKPHSDGLYWAGVSAADTITLVRKADDTGILASLFSGDLTELNHVRFDVGVDFCRAGQQTSITKVGLYGVL